MKKALARGNWYEKSILQKDSPFLQIQNQTKHALVVLPPRLEQKPGETYGKSRGQQYIQSHLRSWSAKELQRIFEVLQIENANYPHDLPTSFVDVENAIAQCISQCLQDYPKHTRSVSCIQSFLREHKVVVFVPGQKYSVSLDRVHTILQDNFPNSSLTMLFNLLCAGFMNTQTKVISFF